MRTSLATRSHGDASRPESYKLQRTRLKRAPRPVRRRLRKPIEETPQAPAPQPVRRRLKKPIEETPQAPAPKRTRITQKWTVPHISPPSGGHREGGALAQSSRCSRTREGPQGGAFGVATPKAKSKPKAKTKEEKPEATIKHTIEEIIKASNLPLGEQALLPKKQLNTKAARTKKGQKKKNGGLGPTLEHHDIQNDPYYIKPPLPTHVK